MNQNINLFLIKLLAVNSNPSSNILLFAYFQSVIAQKSPFLSRHTNVLNTTTFFFTVFAIFALAIENYVRNTISFFK